jgi:acetyltransferase
MRILGPNCLGFVRPLLGLNATFLQGEPPPGDIAFISQSGALGSAIVDWAVSAGIGFSMFASLGSMIDVDFGDMIDFLGRSSQKNGLKNCHNLLIAKSICILEGLILYPCKLYFILDIYRFML